LLHKPDQKSNKAEKRLFILFFLHFYVYLCVLYLINKETTCLLTLNHPLFFGFLANRTDGCAIGTVLRLSVCLSVTFCIMAKRCVLEQTLLWRAYR